jgi:hypothetical protein
MRAVYPSADLMYSVCVLPAVWVPSVRNSPRLAVTVCISVSRTVASVAVRLPPAVSHLDETNNCGKGAG